jgi:hypothetical protein
MNIKASHFTIIIHRKIIYVYRNEIWVKWAERAASTQGTRNAYNFRSEFVKGIRPLGRPSEDGRLTLKRRLKKQVLRVQTGTE